MQFRFYRFSVFLFSCFLLLSVAAILLISQAAAQVVEIPDPNLESAIRETLNIPDNSSITQQQEMLRLTELNARQKQIADLTGLEYAINIRSLILPHNNSRFGLCCPAI